MKKSQTTKNPEHLMLLKSMHRHLLEEQKHLRDKAVCLPYLIAEFDYALNKARKDYTREDLTGLWPLGSDADCPFQKLKSLTAVHKGKDVPIFSESYLYDTLGKDDARTVLALLNSIYTAAGKPSGF